MLFGYWHRVRLLQKLILIVIVFLILPVLIVGYYLFSTSLPLAQKESREMLEKVAYQLNENIEYRIIGYQNILMQMSLDPGITTALTQHYQSLQEEVTALQQINAAVNRIRSYFPMKKIQFYKTNASLHEDGGVVLNMEQADSQPWHAAMGGSNKQFYWYFERKGDDAQPSLHLSKWLVDYLTNEKFGIVHVEITNRALFDQLSNPLEFKKGWIVVADAQGRVLTNVMDKQASDNIKALPYLQPVYASDQGWYSTTIDGKQSMVVYETNRLGWKIVTVVSQEELWQKLQLVKNAAVAVSVLFVVLTIAVLASYGLRIKHRLNSLVRSMRRVRDGDIGLTVKVYGKDELADVEGEFNTMSLRLKQSLGDIAEARSAAETEKLKLLQAQINPHFLYNTLALVKSMAMDVGSAEISRTVDALAKFFRLALNRGGDILPFREELEHVRAYLNIHESRFPGRLAVEIDVDEEALSCEIIKITLQPIIENALLHAFVHTGGRGRLRIRGCLQDGMLCITIADNGSGMTPEQAKDLLENANGAKERAGFGIYNVNERLKRHYRHSYSLTIESKPGAGTTIRLLIPQQAGPTAPAHEYGREELPHGHQSIRR
ncbi:HAMP domain-containing protein [Paenibacillus lycopersici]|uniref:histidine kinase n=1 Tax=Paenibacillus lycopersici TaxID=2704462 RepID=A0A6C0G759_9BACL|nr:sensor histidine kinase [Paenibacillus lycopersici]QHT62995.1 HAMP domain-containing protein [Paenibacillus lycopersici]